MAEDKDLTRNKWAEMTPQQKSDYIDAARASIMKSKRQQRFAKAHDRILAEMKNNPPPVKPTETHTNLPKYRKKTSTKGSTILTGDDNKLIPEIDYTLLGLTKYPRMR